MSTERARCPINFHSILPEEENIVALEALSQGYRGMKAPPIVTEALPDDFAVFKRGAPMIPAHVLEGSTQE